MCDTKKFHDNESAHILHNFWTSTHRGKASPLPPLAPPLIVSYRLLAERDIAYRVIVVAGVPLSAALLSPHAASEASETLAIISGRASHGLGAVDRLRADMTACRARCVLAGALTRPPPLPVVATQHNTHTVGIRYETEMTIIIIIIKVKVKFSHTRYRALGPELIPVYSQSARR